MQYYFTDFKEFASGLSDLLQTAGHAVISLDWTEWVTGFLILFFFCGVFQSIRIYLRAEHTIRYQIDAPKPTIKQVQELAFQKEKDIPFILILVPARDEAEVIANTLHCLARLDYPRQHYAVMVITDERERSAGEVQTTGDVARGCANALNHDPAAPWLYVVDVPEWYSGRFGSPNHTFRHSTKGRALNYALQYLRADKRLSQADMIGVMDADGRMHPEALREVAFKRLRDDAKVLQGPVFQISNYPNVSLSGKAAGIELSIYHLSTLAYRLQKRKHSAEFLAGTNYFIDPKIVIDLGGWNEQALTEDAELGLRLFLKKQIRPGWLSCHEIEQTPPDYKVYLQQRQRWAMGHFQLLSMIHKTALPLDSKIFLSARVLSAILKSPLDIALPVLGWVALLLDWTQGFPQWLDWIMIGLFIGSLYSWNFFGRGYQLIKKYAPHHNKNYRWYRIDQLQFIFAMPWLILLQALPRLLALFKYLTGFEKEKWVKTKRTAEEPLNEFYWPYPICSKSCTSKELTKYVDQARS